MSEHIRTVFITEQNDGNALVGRLATIDERIVIDEPAENVRWFCDHCDEGFAVTAEFVIPILQKRHITLCRTCLQNAINGIDLRLANGGKP